MVQNGDTFQAILGFFCCQLYILYWGWVNADNLKMTDVMLFWSFLVVLGIILEIVTGAASQILGRPVSF
jgi:hypothetical protein